MRYFLMAMCFFGATNTLYADDRDRHLNHADGDRVEFKILREIRELQQMVADLRKDMIEIKRTLRRQRGEIISHNESWGCSVQPPFNEPAYYGVGRSMAEATREAIEKCSSHASSKNRKYCEASRVQCSEQR